MSSYNELMNLKAQLKAIDDLEEVVDEMDWDMDDVLEEEGLENAAKAAPWLLGALGIGAVYLLISKLYKKFFGKVEVAADKIKKTINSLADEKASNGIIIPVEDLPEVTVNGKLAKLIATKYNLNDFDKLMSYTDKVLEWAESSSDIFKDLTWTKDKDKAEAIRKKIKEESTFTLGQVTAIINTLALNKSGNFTATTNYKYITTTLKADSEEFHTAMRKGTGLADQCDAIAKQFELVSKLDDVENVIPEAKAVVSELKAYHSEIKKVMGDVATVAAQLTLLTSYVSSQLVSWKNKNTSEMQSLAGLVRKYTLEVSKTEPAFYKDNKDAMESVVKDLEVKDASSYISVLKEALKAIRAGKLYKQAAFNSVFNAGLQSKVDLVLKGQYPYQFEKGKDKKGSHDW